MLDKISDGSIAPSELCGVVLNILHSSAVLVKRRIDSVKVLAVQMLLRPTEGIGKTVNMKH